MPDIDLNTDRSEVDPRSRSVRAAEQNLRKGYRLHVDHDARVARFALGPSLLSLPYAAGCEVATALGRDFPGQITETGQPHPAPATPPQPKPAREARPMPEPTPAPAATEPTPAPAAESAADDARILVLTRPEYTVSELARLADISPFRLGALYRTVPYRTDLSGTKAVKHYRTGDELVTALTVLLADVDVRIGAPTEDAPPPPPADEPEAPASFVLAPDVRPFEEVAPEEAPPEAAPKAGRTQMLPEPPGYNVTFHFRGTPTDALAGLAGGDGEPADDFDDDHGAPALVMDAVGDLASAFGALAEAILAGDDVQIDDGREYLDVAVANCKQVRDSVSRWLGGIDDVIARTQRGAKALEGALHPIPDPFA